MGSLAGLTHLRAGHEGAGLEPDKQQDDPSRKGSSCKGFITKPQHKAPKFGWFLSAYTGGEVFVATKLKVQPQVKQLQ